MIKLKALIIIAIIGLNSISLSNPIPDKLFGITLGEVYDLEDMPVKKATGVNKFLGQGLHYYFEPIEVSDFFQYIEKKKKPDDEFYETSFSAYVLPVIPSNIDSMEELNKANLKVQVTNIAWTIHPEKNDQEANEESYYWAYDLCKTFSVKFSIKPEIGDINKRAYTCTFTSGEKEFQVQALSYKRVTLGYINKVSSKKHEAVEMIIRRLLAKKILP